MESIVPFPSFLSNPNQSLDLETHEVPIYDAIAEKDENPSATSLSICHVVVVEVWRS